jgi:hypothetical protein
MKKTLLNSSILALLLATSAPTIATETSALTTFIAEVKESGVKLYQKGENDISQITGKVVEIYEAGVSKVSDLNEALSEYTQSDLDENEAAELKADEDASAGEILDSWLDSGAKTATRLYDSGTKKALELYEAWEQESSSETDNSSTNK